MSVILFEDLPIVTPHTEYGADGWRRSVMRETTVRELLETWDIDDPSEQSEIAQVLRHLRDCFTPEKKQ